MLRLGFFCFVEGRNYNFILLKSLWFFYFYEANTIIIITYKYKMMELYSNTIIVNCVN